MEIVSREYIIEHLVRQNKVMDEDMLYKIEEALGFELTPSQITYIITGEMRYTGKTTAEAIRDYLYCLQSGIKLNYVPTSQRNHSENRHKTHIIRQLLQSGLPEIKVHL